MNIRYNNGTPRPWLGFTLIELMITVAIIGILSAIVFPSFIDSVRKSRRAAGKAVLLQTVQNIERFYTLSNNYTTAVASSIGGGGILSENGYYLIPAPPAASSTATTYMLSAVPQGGQTNDRCGTLFIDETGAKSSSSALTVAECW